MTAPIGPSARRIFAGLVETAGGVEASAAILSARKGAAVHKSTVSRMVHDQIPVTVEAASAMEDALGVWPLSQLLFARIGRRAGGGDLRALAAEASVECGEAVAAIISAFGAQSLDPSRMTDDERARARAEVAEALEVLTRISALLDDEGGAR
ncbi:hypothetical protein [Pikeienuella sp. HZG-20]|uniref:hypothetical protein n=1 Tax=Paludibacillus litoralis TaxID=3133267 RepID=UPI0030EBEF5C